MNRILLVLFLLLAVACSSGDDAVTPLQNNPGNGNGGNGGSGGNEDPDGDGVINSTELTDGTDPNDLCSFVMSSQTLEPSNAWNASDCDDDCLSNALEKRFGSDPLDPNSTVDFEGRIRGLSDDGSPQYYLDETGQQLDYIFYTPWYERNYNYENGRIKSVVYSDTNAGFLIDKFEFFYNGDQMDFIRWFDVHDITVEYDANTITTYHAFSPTAKFATKIELDPVSQKVVRMEEFQEEIPNSYNYTVSVFNYDVEMNNVLQVDIESYNYYEDTDEFVLTNSYSETYEYYQDILNPLYDVYSTLELPYRLSRWYGMSIGQNEIMSSPLPVNASFSKNLVSSYTTYFGTTTYVPNDCATEIGYPFSVMKNFTNSSRSMTFFYTPF